MFPALRPGPGVVAGTPDVSVILPARNAAGFLGPALDSALGQAGVALEVVAVDDGSEDATAGILAARAAADPRLRVLRHDRARGAAAARNTALAAAAGRWVAPLDADDAFLPGRLAALLEEARASRADLLADDLLLRDHASGAPRGTALPPAALALAGRPLRLAELLRLDDVEAPGFGKPGYLKPLIRRDLLEGAGIAYRADGRLGEDLELYAAAIAAGGRFVLSRRALYAYALREGSWSRRAGAADLVRGVAGLRGLARRAGLLDAEVAALLRARERALATHAFGLAVQARDPLAALRHAAMARNGAVLRRALSACRAIWRGAPAPPALPPPRPPAGRR